MHKPEHFINELNRAYGFDWALHDFAVVDEKYPNKENELPFRVDGYIIGICLKGWLNVELDMNRYEGEKKSMLITKPLQLFRFLEMSDDCRIRFIIFSNRFLVANGINQRVIETFQFTQVNALPVITIEETEAKNIALQFEVIWQRFNEVNHLFRKEVVSQLLLVLLYEFEAIYRKHFCLLEQKSSRRKELVRQFTELVQKHFCEEHTVDFYAKALYVTPKYLTTTIKEVTGKTASAFIVEALAIEAQVLLRQPALSVKEVANKLNFTDQSIFGKFFKRAVGVSPLDYKNSAH